MANQRKSESHIPCPSCGADMLVVTDSRPATFRNRSSIRRRRKCQACDHRFSTFEVAAETVEDLEREVKKSLLIEVMAGL